MLQALANAEIGRGEYELWAADREVFRVLNAAVTAAKLTVLLGTVYASGSALTPLLAAEISSALASEGLQVYEWLTEQPEEFVMRTAAETLGTELRHRMSKSWQNTADTVAVGAQILTHDQAKSYMLWRHVVIRQSGASMTIEEGTESWDEWVPSRVAITLEARIPPSLSLARLGRDPESPGSESIPRKLTLGSAPGVQTVQITRELPIGWYAIYISETSRLLTKEFSLAIAGDNVVRRTLLAEVTPAGTGQVRLDPWNGHAGRYRDGETVRLLADPASGNRFVRWQGDLSGANNPSSTRMVADRTVHAVFERVAAHDDGDCAVGSVVQPDHYCRYPGTSRLFERVADERGPGALVARAEPDRD